MQLKSLQQSPSFPPAWRPCSSVIPTDQTVCVDCTLDHTDYVLLLCQAIQEFTDLCKNSTVAAVESALPFWPRLFNKLSMVV